MSYVIRRAAAGWAIYAETGTHIGTLKSRKEAISIARLLAGWRGSVSIERRARAW